MAEAPTTTPAAEPLHKCYECGYPLGSLPDNEQCPECGADAAYARLTLVQRFPRAHLLRRAHIASLVAIATVLALPIAVVVFWISLFVSPDGVYAPVVATILGVWLGAWTLLALQNPASQPWRVRIPVADLSLAALGVTIGACGAYAMTIQPYADPYRFDAAELIFGLLPLALVVHLSLGALVSARILRKCYRARSRVLELTVVRWSTVIALVVGLPITVHWIVYETSGYMLFRPPPAIAAAALGIPMLLWLYAMFLVLVAGALSLRLAIALRHASRRYKAHLERQRAGAGNTGIEVKP